MVAIISLSFIYHVSVQFAVVLQPRPCLRSLQTPISFKILEEENGPYLSSHDTNESSSIVSERLALLQHAVFQLQAKAIHAIINETEYNVLRKTTKPNKLKKLNHPVCQYFIKEGKRQRYMETNIWKDTGTYDPLDVTLVTQITTEKLGTFSKLLTHWKGPVSCSIYVNKEDAEELIQFIRRFPNILNRENVDIHLVMKAEMLYPINLLRNIALNNSYTQFVFLTDVDFMPSYGLHQYLLDIIPTRSHLKQEICTS